MSIMYNWKTKTLIACVLFVSVFSLGLYARPGFDKFAGLFAPKSTLYIAPMSDFDRMVQGVESTQEHKTLCHDAAVRVVADTLTREYAIIADEKTEKWNEYTIRINSGVSLETAIETDRIERAQGRR